MRKFILERILPGAGNLTKDEIEKIRLETSDAMNQLGIQYIWFESFVTENKIYCIHGATNKEDIIKLTKLLNLPITSIEEVIGKIGPTIEK